MLHRPVSVKSCTSRPQKPVSRGEPGGDNARDGRDAGFCMGDQNYPPLVYFGHLRKLSFLAFPIMFKDI